jgi:hypothetical protein
MWNTSKAERLAVAQWVAKRQARTVVELYELTTGLWGTAKLDNGETLTYTETDRRFYLQSQLDKGQR